MIINSIKRIHKIILLIALFYVFSISSVYSYDLSILDWSNSKKNYCARNVKNVLWIEVYWNASDFTKHTNIKEPEIWSVAVINKYNKDFQSKWTMWYKYGHVWIVYEINAENNTVTMFDWIYRLTLKQSVVYWYISESKLIELWATIY